MISSYFHHSVVPPGGMNGSFENPSSRGSSLGLRRCPRSAERDIPLHPEAVKKLPGEGAGSPTELVTHCESLGDGAPSRRPPQISNFSQIPPSKGESLFH